MSGQGSPHTPERNRSQIRDQERARREPMTSPSVRRRSNQAQQVQPVNFQLPPLLPPPPNVNHYRVQQPASGTGLPVLLGAINLHPSQAGGAPLQNPVNGPPVAAPPELHVQQPAQRIRVRNEIAQGDPNVQNLSRAQIAQRARRAREREAREAQARPPIINPPPFRRNNAPWVPLNLPVNQQMPLPPIPGPAHHAGALNPPMNQQVPVPPQGAAPVTRRSLGQQARRRREREQREAREQQQLAELQQHGGAEAEAPDAGVLQDLPAPRLDNIDARQAAKAARRQFAERVRALGRHTLGPMDDVCPDCGALHFKDERLKKKVDDKFRFGVCCKSGKVDLPLTKRPPELLWKLLTGAHPQSNLFFENIRRYNIALSFTSLGVDKDLTGEQGAGGPYVFKIMGELRHQTGALQPVGDEPRRYAQLWIFDSTIDATEIRMQRTENQACDRELMQKLAEMIQDNHFYAPLYKAAHQRMIDEGAQRVSLRVVQDRRRDPRTYNKPVTDEIALIVPNAHTHGGDLRDIVLHLNDGGLRRISQCHPAYLCLHYVLLFVQGEHGFTPGIPFAGPDWQPNNQAADEEAPSEDEPVQVQQGGRARGARRNVSMLEFCSFMLFPREQFGRNNPYPQDPETHFSTILRGRRLLQQLVVDLWAIIDQSRLHFLRQNQKLLRVEQYNGIQDLLQGDENVTAADVGQRIILPSSYKGGPRQMHECYQDSMAITRKFGPPQLFVTFTMNPNLPDVLNALLPGQKPADRPDIIARVFNLKKKALLQLITDKQGGVFGRCIAHIYTIEFQKRGLPHMHLLVWLAPESAIVDTNDVDELVCAELPDRDANPLLWQTVTSNMIHGPCGDLNPNAPCMVEKDGVKKCSKNFPKRYKENTTMTSNSYPEYRRTEGPYVEKNGHRLGNCWVVPYNKVLSQHFDAHINVEICASVLSVKYIHKYVYKGPDQASVDVVSPQDEIQARIDSRFLTASEAAWHLNQNKMHQESPNVVRLQVHMPNGQSVTFEPDDDLQDVLDAQSKTQLTEYFALNSSANPVVRNQAREMVYQEIPTWFSWVKKEKRWNMRRLKTATIGRMVFIPPGAGESFFLRLLLCSVEGATSFEALRRFNDQLYPTFQECCRARGLLEDDREWEQCLTEASVMKTGSQLRQLFATILTACFPSDAQALWLRFREHICDDLGWRLRHAPFNRPAPTDEESYDYGLYLMQDLVQGSGKTMTELGMPVCQHDWAAEVGNRLINEQRNYDHAYEQRRATEQIALLNAQQQDAFHTVLQSVRQNQGTPYFIDGPAGTGKTFLYTTLCHELRKLHDIVLCVASSGIAALLLPGGRTSHSMFHIPVLRLLEDSVCSIKKRTNLADLLKATKLIIWDEVPMQHRFGPEAFDRSCRDILDQPTKPFGGITVVFGGDFRQCLPVVPKGTKEEIIAACLKKSPLWPSIRTLKLTENMRIRNDPNAAQFAQWLLELGEGRNFKPGSTELIEFPAHMKVENLNELFSSIYPDLDALDVRNPNSEALSLYFKERTILCPKNDGALQLNEQLLEKFPGEAETFQSADAALVERGADMTEARHTVEYLNTLICSGLPPSKLRLKVGCPVMVLRNLAPTKGVCNGSRAVVTRMTQRVLEVRLLTGDQAGE